MHVWFNIMMNDKPNRETPGALADANGHVRFSKAPQSVDDSSVHTDLQLEVSTDPFKHLYKKGDHSGVWSIMYVFVFVMLQNNGQFQYREFSSAHRYPQCKGNTPHMCWNSQLVLRFLAVMIALLLEYSGSRELLILIVSTVDAQLHPFLDCTDRTLLTVSHFFFSLSQASFRSHVVSFATPKDNAVTNMLLGDVCYLGVELQSG